MNSHLYSIRDMLQFLLHIHTHTHTHTQREPPNCCLLAACRARHTKSNSEAQPPVQQPAVHCIEVLGTMAENTLCVCVCVLSVWVSATGPSQHHQQLPRKFLFLSFSFMGSCRRSDTPVAYREGGAGEALMDLL